MKNHQIVMYLDEPKFGVLDGARLLGERFYSKEEAEAWAKEHFPEDKYASAIEQGRAQLESIREMIQTLREARAKLEAAENADVSEMGPREAQGLVEAAEEAIQEDPLSLVVRSGWHSPGAKSDGAEEYRLLLCTGGPACQIRGRLDQYCQPENDSWLEVQDWFVPWKAIELEPEDREVLREYARCFYYEE